MSGGTTINISGNSNDSNLVLGSSGASITENASSNLQTSSWVNPLLSELDMQNIVNSTQTYFQQIKLADVVKNSDNTVRGIFNGGFNIIGNAETHKMETNGVEMLAYSNDTANVLNKKLPNSDSILPIFSLTKAMCGLVGVIVGQELETTIGAYQLNGPLGKTLENSGPTSVITPLKNTTYKILKKVDTRQEFVIPVGRTNAGDNIVEAMRDVSNSYIKIETGKFYLLSQVIEASANLTENIDYRKDINYKLDNPTRRLTPAHLLSQTTGQSIIGISYFKGIDSRQEFAGFPYSYTETNNLMQLMYSNGIGGHSYPDDCGLSAVTETNQEPEQVSLLLAEPGSNTYGGGMYAWGYYMHQQLYSKINSVDPTTVTYATLCNCGWDVESILYKYLVKPLIDDSTRLTNVDCYWSMSELKDPHNPTVVLRPAFTDAQKTNIESRWLSPAAFFADASTNYNLSQLHLFHNRYLGQNRATLKESGKFYYNTGSNLMASVNFICEFAQLILRRGQKKNSNNPVINIEEPFVKSSASVMNQYMYEKHIPESQMDGTFSANDTFEAALTVQGVPYNWGHGSSDKIVYNQNAGGYGQITPIISVLGANILSLLIYPQHGYFSLICGNVYPVNSQAYILYMNTVEKVVNKHTVLLADKLVESEKFLN